MKRKLVTIVAALYLDILAVALPADSSVRASSRDRTLEGLQREFRSSRRGLEPHVESYHAADSSALAAGGEAEEPSEFHYNEPVQDLIQPRVDIPFLQGPDDFGHMGVSLTMHGEPKSGTTWLAGIMVELVVRLCGNSDNEWCEVGRLETSTQHPLKYSLEMLYTETGGLFLHFMGGGKHTIPGLDVGEDCARGGQPHSNGFSMGWPCETRNITDEALTACLPDTDTVECLPSFPSLDLDERRMVVVFRDPRDVVVSEHRMRTDLFGEDLGGLDPYIRGRFEDLVGWIHQRWVWHTTFLRPVSYIVLNESLKVNPLELVDLAAFMGLKCSPEEAEKVWNMPVIGNSHGDYTTYGLPDDTLRWMNATLSRVMPPDFLVGYGLAPLTR